MLVPSSRLLPWVRCPKARESRFAGLLLKPMVVGLDRRILTFQTGQAK
jgi:hypothetical protein